ncbi:MAG: S8 family serine peptidase [Bacteroidales bacterium]|nr:S8 family serine peptidase [Bacteroidales bacterium]
MKKQNILILLILPLLASCMRQEPVTLPTTTDSAPASESSYIPGKAVLLISEEGADSFDLAGNTETLEALGVRSVERMFPDAGEFEARHRAAGLHRWYRVSYDPSVARTKAGQDLSTLPDVEAVVFEPRKERRAIFNDPKLSDQWHYINTGQNSGFVPGIDINVEPVWQDYTGGTQDVIVAVLDGGIQSDHVDLGGVVLTAEEGSRNFVKGYDPDQLLTDDHGTHVAGTIAAINNNGIGVCGVAGGLDGKGGVRLMACNIFGPKKTDSGDDAAALVWAADHGAVIANNSWGYIADSDEEAAAITDYFLNTETPLRNAIDYFIKNAGTDADGNQTGPMKGGLILFASGNEGYTHDAPSEYEPIVAVGAFGPDGKMPLFSNYGPWVDILAPGGSDSKTAYKEWVLSTLPTNSYAYMRGTSMACPHAAGVAALLVSYFGGPGYTAGMLKEALLGGAKMNVLDLQGRTVGGGKLDALGSFQIQSEPENPTADDIKIATNYNGDWVLKAHESLEVVFRITGNGKAKLPVSVTSDCAGVADNCTPRMVTCFIDALRAQPGSYTLTIHVGDLVDMSFPFTILPNHAPEQRVALENQVVNAASAALMTLKLDEIFEDPDGEELDYALEVSGDSIVTGTIDGSTLTLTPRGYGLATVNIQAFDARRTSCTASFQILGRNEYVDVDVFPNPVVSVLHVRPASDRTVPVELVNASGTLVYSSPSVNMGPFSQLDIDMTEMAGGTYTLFVNGERFGVVKK